MPGIIWSISLAAELFLDRVAAVGVGVVPAQWAVGVGAAHQDGPGVHPRQHPHVVLAVVLPLPLHQAKLSILLAAAPVDSLQYTYVL